MATSVSCHLPRCTLPLQPPPMRCFTVSSSAAMTYGAVASASSDVALQRRCHCVRASFRVSDRR